MSGDNYHYGDQVNQIGNHNIGIIKQEAADPQAALHEMIKAVEVLRGTVSSDDRAMIDESMQVVRSGDDADKGRLRAALRNIAGVAAMVGQVGVPVIEAIRGVMKAFGI